MDVKVGWAMVVVVVVSRFGGSDVGTEVNGVFLG